MSSTRELFFKHLAQTSDFPLGLEVHRADGNYLYDRNEKPYLDLISGIAVSNLGHNHPEITNAIKKQLDHHMHVMVYGEIIQSPQVELAYALAQHLPKNLSSSYFVNSGSEAIEGALKLCKRFSGKHEFIAFNNAYHGSSNGALSLAGNRVLQGGFFPLLPGVKHLPFNDEKVLGQISEHTAAVFIEPIQGEAGVRVANLSFLEALRKRCDVTNTLLVFDEIQSGYGRTGKLFAFEHYNIVPDILILAKGFGAGMPLGAFIASEEIMSCLRNDPVLGHISTFGGHPLSCAASLAALEVITKGGLMQDVTKKEQLFKSLLQHTEIKEVRGKGLMLAVELSDFEKVQSVLKRYLEQGVMSDWFLFCDNSLRIAPPLTITEDEIRTACTTLLEVL